MMKGLLLLGAISLQLGWIHAIGPDGVGVFSYQGQGQRYAGTYGIKDGKVVDVKGNLPPDFTPPDFTHPDINIPDFFPPNFKTQDFSPPEFPDDTLNDSNSDFDEDFNAGFAPTYFKNLEALLKDSPFSLPFSKPFENFPFNQPFFTPPLFPPPVFNTMSFPTLNPFSMVTNMINRMNSLPFSKPFENFPFNQPFFTPPLLPPPVFNTMSFPTLNPFSMETNMINQMNSAFQNNLEIQRQSFEAAQRAFDMTANQAGFSPFPMPSPIIPMVGNGVRRSFAGAAVGPGFNQQTAFISPGNPLMPNINTVSLGSGDGGFKGVSVSSYSLSSNVDGKVKTAQGANTMINDNGKITSHSVHDP